MRTILFAAACGLLAMTATAADPVPAAPPAAEAATPPAAAPATPMTKQEIRAKLDEARKAKDEKRLVCKRNHEVGSRLNKKTCMTKAEWEAVRAQQAKDGERMRDRLYKERGYPDPTPGMQ